MSNLPKVQVYSTPSCKYCNEAKEYMTERRISFENINCVGNPEAISKVRELSGGVSVPVIVVGDKVLLGWSQPEFDAAYSE